MYKFTISGHSGERVLFETPNEKEMASYIFFCGHYDQGVALDAYIDLHLPDNRKLTHKTMDKWVENLLPEETANYQEKKKADTGFIRKNLINYGIIKGHIIEYMENGIQNRPLYKKNMEERKKPKI